MGRGVNGQERAPLRIRVQAAPDISAAMAALMPDLERALLTAGWYSLTTEHLEDGAWAAASYGHAASAGVFYSLSLKHDEGRLRLTLWRIEATGAPRKVLRRVSDIGAETDVLWTFLSEGFNAVVRAINRRRPKP